MHAGTTGPQLARPPQLDSLRYLILGAALGQGIVGYQSLILARPVKQWPRAWLPLMQAIDAMVKAEADPKAKGGPIYAAAREEYVTQLVKLLGIEKPDKGKLLEYLFATWQKQETAEGFRVAGERLRELSVRCPVGASGNRSIIRELRDIAKALEDSEHVSEDKSAGEKVAASATAPQLAKGHAKAGGGHAAGGMVGANVGKVPHAAGAVAGAGHQQDKRMGQNRAITAQGANGAAGRGSLPG